MAGGRYGSMVGSRIGCVGSGPRSLSERLSTIIIISAVSSSSSSSSSSARPYPRGRPGAVSASISSRRRRCARTSAIARVGHGANGRVALRYRILKDARLNPWRKRAKRGVDHLGVVDAQPRVESVQRAQHARVLKGRLQRLRLRGDRLARRASRCRRDRAQGAGRSWLPRGCCSSRCCCCCCCGRWGTGVSSLLPLVPPRRSSRRRSWLPKILSDGAVGRDAHALLHDARQLRRRVARR